MLCKFPVHKMPTSNSEFFFSLEAAFKNNRQKLLIKLLFCEKRGFRIKNWLLAKKMKFVF